MVAAGTYPETTAAAGSVDVLRRVALVDELLFRPRSSLLGHSTSWRRAAAATVRAFSDAATSTADLRSMSTGATSLPQPRATSIAGSPPRNDAIPKSRGQRPGVPRRAPGCPSAAARARGGGAGRRRPRDHPPKPRRRRRTSRPRPAARRGSPHYSRAAPSLVAARRPCLRP